MKRYLILLLLVALAGCSGLADIADTIDDSVNGNMDELVVGVCFDDEAAMLEGDEEALISSVPQVDCSESHDNEVYHTATSSYATDYPGFEAFASEADQICFDQFEAFTGEDYSTSDLDFGWFIPSDESFEQGDREIVCFVYHMDLEKLTGSMAASS